MEGDSEKPAGPIDYETLWGEPEKHAATVTRPSEVKMCPYKKAKCLAWSGSGCLAKVCVCEEGKS